MAELKARTACGDALPIVIGAAQLTELDLGPVTSVTAWGSQQELSAAMKAAHGMAFPKPNRSGSKNAARCIWFGRNQALLIGAAADASLGEHAAIVDQSDAWCAVSLSGEATEAVLARLVPVDIRRAEFKRGHTVRTQVGHMPASITRTGPDSFMILVFRSMATTLIHELKQAMQSIVARRA
ncbi:sarcosine oxidase subunit gamma [Sulfitobacter marinus]|uniref:Sarcosine oxidase subunit gamma n=1 Tax=Sulfitobacter marinus TaxID=394264 RepID=A0A1I6RV86_9RHOB|nr:sarcosine oxidase subunit gamma [Sulfitobacter marinus]SFS68629.1 sarcosine oxidase subunit gamma [Sulfitobacter marinus]